jgi:hypothetical protein
MHPSQTQQSIIADDDEDTNDDYDYDYDADDDRGLVDCTTQAQRKHDASTRHEHQSTLYPTQSTS